MSKAGYVLLAGLSAFSLSSVSASAATYYVAIDGAQIDLSGTVEIDGTGVFELADFDALLSSFSITVSNNGINPFEFTDANSTFGLAPPVTPDSTITVTATEIYVISTSSRTGNASDDVLLATDDLHEGVRPNLIYNNDHARYIVHEDGQPDATAEIYFDDFGPSPFILATTTPPLDVPLPAGGVIYATALVAGMAAGSKRRRAPTMCRGA
ncbi:hypothetical protein [Rhodovulum sp. P5]|uniref:hypothetical protein n=1 Tax=Rhodovulum sp. P5 TaxID=1564506 RepID=UPI0009DA9FF7|nr:hypothetical protein [Rhodovulum sp. P5]